MTTFFADTSGFIAALDAQDPQHRRASAWIRETPDDQYITTNYVVLEAVSLAHRRLGRAAVELLIDQLLPLARIHFVDEATHLAGVARFLRSTPRVSLVDAVSFEVMDQLGIRTAFAFDRDFSREGYAVVP